MHTVCLLRSQLNFTRAALRKREYMVQKRSKMTIISDILPVKIYVWTAIPKEPRQVHSGHTRVNVAGKKLRARKGTRESSFLEGTATSFPGPAPHDFHTCLRRGLSPDQKFSLAELIADDDKEQKNWGLSGLFPGARRRCSPKCFPDISVRSDH